MIHDAERVLRRESHLDLAERGVRDPLVAVLPDLGASQPGGPARQVPRVGGERVDLGRSAGDVDADVVDVVHGTHDSTRDKRGYSRGLNEPWARNSSARRRSGGESRESFAAHGASTVA